MKLQNGDYILTEEIDEENYKKICEFFEVNTGASNPNWSFGQALIFPAFGLCDESKFIVHGPINEFKGRKLSVNKILGADDKPHFDFSRRPDSGKDWHEKGELPPVDVQCMQGNHIVQIVAHLFNGENKYAAFQHVDGNGCGYSHADSFRPLKSERERAIEEMLKLDCHPQEGILSRHDFCGALYDAGFRKEGK